MRATAPFDLDGTCVPLHPDPLGRTRTHGSRLRRGGARGRRTAGGAGR